MQKRGHTSLRATSYWGTRPTATALAALPAGGFDPQRCADRALSARQGATSSAIVMVRQAVPRSLPIGSDVVLVAPQLALDAADSSARQFLEAGPFRRYIDEAAERLMRLTATAPVGRTFNLAPVVVVPTAAAISRRYNARARRRQHRHQGSDPVGLASWRGTEFAGWPRPAGARLPAQRLYRVTKDENAARKGCSTSAAFPMSGACRPPWAGNDGFVACGGSNAWRFVTRACGLIP